MAEIPILDPSEAPRARRWDALILGSGLSALLAAARISGAGHRVLVVEEEARIVLPPALREPFFLGGLRDQGLLDASLRALAIPLIDRRRISNERLAYQIAADPIRMDVGQPMLTAEELVAWGLAKPDEAQTLVRHLVEASEIERALLFESPFVRVGRRTIGALNHPAASGGPGTAPGLGHHKRGLPGAAASASGNLAHALDAQVRALSNLGDRSPAPEARARLLGLALAGGAGFSDDPPWLVDLFRKRVTALYGDMRTLTGNFELVSVSGQPGIRVVRTGEIWLGRTLVIAAPPSALRDAYGDDPMRPAPHLLEREGPRAYRAVFLYRTPTSILPEGMGARVILPGADRKRPIAAVTAYPCQTHPNRVDLVARAVINDVSPETLEARSAALRAEIGDRLRALMPFCSDELAQIEVEMPRWDSDDGWLEDPTDQTGWPGEIDLRLSSRPPIFHLDRAAAAGLGLEGDLLLGWRGGDAIAAELG
ncbi:MAG: NAD(P)/FAD-dependent oxidoreductase [bacterium]|nr:hypothetical protein [Deltaproteobacteria bacterium]MCP4905099.1 NAD(P)/FAD-dependent oxidoreductase [bacterium]